LLELPDRRVRDEVEILPQAVEATLLRVVEDQLVQRAIVAKVPHLAVKAGAQQAMALGVGRDLAWVGQEHPPALRDVKPIREQRAEARKRILVSRARRFR